MPEYGYSYKESGAKFAKAQVHDVDASFKDLCAVCDAIRRKDTEEALELLEKVAGGDWPILYRTHNKHLGHRHELGGKKGRYPQKSAKVVLKLLKNAIANAEFKGMDGLVVKHAAANKQSIFPRMAPKGRSRRANYETARIEVVLEESPESRKGFAAKKDKAAKALSKADRDKLVREESEKLKNHITTLVKQKQAEKRKEKEGEKKEGAHTEHSHPHEKKEQPAHSHTEKGQEHTQTHGGEHRHESGNDPKHMHSREGEKHER